MIERVLVLALLAAGGVQGATVRLELAAGSDLATARDRARSLRADAGQPVEVVLAEGVYRLTGPLAFDARDGGVTWRAADGAEVVISGGVKLTGWKQLEDGVWFAALPGGVRPRELFVNGTRAVRARHPDEGFLRIGRAAEDNRSGFTFTPGDFPLPEDVSNVELVFLHDWSSSRIPVESIDPETGWLRTAHPVGPGANHYRITHYEPHPRYWLEGARAFLNRPGEWWADPEAGVMHYRPRPGQDPASIDAVVPVAAQLLEIRGDRGGAGPVRDLAFQGLTFAHCAWPLPEGGYAAGQAAFHERRDGTAGNELRQATPPAVRVDHADGIAFRNCRFAHLGGSAVWIREWCADAVFESNVIEDVSGNGLMVGEDRTRKVDNRPWTGAAPEQATARVRVTGNRVREVGRQFFGSVAIWVGMARDVHIERNRIHDCPYTGISLGWMWNPEPTPCQGHVVRGNHIHRVMQVLSDGGGIYTLGSQPGTRLEDNVIHEVPLNAGRAESNGMFLDEGTTGIVISGNVIYGVDRSPLRFHKAGKNRVEGNVLGLGLGGDGQPVPRIRYNRTEPGDILQVDNLEIPEDGDAARARLEAAARPILDALPR